MDNEDTDNTENGNNVIISSTQPNQVKRWWKSRTKNERKLTFALLGTTVTVLIALAVYFCLFYDRNTICKSADCQAAALQISNFIDETSRPCEDFYQFACGKFLRNNSFDEPYVLQSVQIQMKEEILTDISKILEEEPDPSDLPSLNVAKKFYKSCMNEQAINKAGLGYIHEIFKQMGGWPIVDGEEWNPENFHWHKSINNLRKIGANFDFFFNITIEVDQEHPEQHIIAIHDKFYSPSELTIESKRAYLDYMVNVASQFGPRVDDLRSDMNNVLHFLLSLGKISEESQLTNRSSLYYPCSLTEIQEKYHTIRWVDVIQGALGKSTDLRIEDVVNIADPVYLSKLELLLGRTDKRVVANFMGWRIIQSLINFLPSKILDRAYEFLQKINVNKQNPLAKEPRWRTCVQASRDRLSPPINVGYIQRHFSDQLKRNVSDLIRNVKYEFKKTLLMMGWLDDETKATIKHMLVSSLVRIYSDLDVLKVVKESKIFELVKIEDQNPLKAVLDLNLINMDLHYALLRQKVQDEWIKSHTFIDGLKVVYSPSENALKFPLGLFRGLFYQSNRPEYMNYGLLGTILAHQIAHIFVEAEGELISASRVAEYRLLNWWTPLSKQRYVQKLKCLTNQYSRFELKVENIKTNAYVTRDEDLADLAGFKVAYNTYVEKEWKDGREPLLPGIKFTTRQLFWISSALQFCAKFPPEYMKQKYLGNWYRHSPSEFRVNGPLQNLEEFSKDFKCPAGSYMNPYKKCHIW